MNSAWQRRLFNPSRFIKSKKIYILPTFSGGKLFLVNLLLLLVGLIFANNFVLFFDFLLFGLFVCSMFYTHFNLDQVELVSARFDEAHSGEFSHLHFVLKNSGPLAKTGLHIKLPDSTYWEVTQSPYFDLSPHELKEVRIIVKLKKRGIIPLHYLSLSTTYPFNFFRSFSHLASDCELTIYPARNLSVEEMQWSLTKRVNHESSEDLSLVKHEVGQSLARIFWKRFALTGEMYTKSRDSDATSVIKLDWNEIQEKDLEKKLIFLTSAITYLEDRSMPWEAVITDQIFNSKQSLKKTLSYLAQMTKEKTT